MVRASKSVEKTTVAQSAPVETVAPVATETKQRVKKVKSEVQVSVAPVAPVETPAPVVAPSARFANAAATFEAVTVDAPAVKVNPPNVNV